MLTESRGRVATSDAERKLYEKDGKVLPVKGPKEVLVCSTGAARRNLLDSSHMNSVYADLHSLPLLRGVIRSFFPEGLRGSSGKDLNQHQQRRKKMNVESLEQFRQENMAKAIDLRNQIADDLNKMEDLKKQMDDLAGMLFDLQNRLNDHHRSLAEIQNEEEALLLLIPNEQ